MECNKTFLWFGVDFIALRYSTVIVILCNKNIDILQHNVLVVCTVSQSGEGFIRFTSATRIAYRLEVSLQVDICSKYSNNPEHYFLF